MATRSTSTPPTRPAWQHPFLAPGVFAAVALLLLVLGESGYAFASLLLALGTLLYLMGSARRWKGAPQAGLVVVGAGVIIALSILFG
ncbi:MAG: hypothetical protein AAGI91_09140 [Bacteroidota bacterium]